MATYYVSNALCVLNSQRAKEGFELPKSNSSVHITICFMYLFSEIYFNFLNLILNIWFQTEKQNCNIHKTQISKSFWYKDLGQYPQYLLNFIV